MRYGDQNIFYMYFFFILGYSDFGEEWRSEQFDDTKDLMEICEKAWNDILPLYKKLHAYVRMRLRNYYAEKFPNYNFPKDGTIPAHLLGNESLCKMWKYYLPLIIL